MFITKKNYDEIIKRLDACEKELGIGKTDCCIWGWGIDGDMVERERPTLRDKVETIENQIGGRTIYRTELEFIKNKKSNKTKK